MGERVERVQVAKPMTTSGEGAGDAKRSVKSNVKNVKLVTDRGVSIGENSPCPCGSGKRYKRCCGAKKKES